jgi:hypothetical protein
MIAAVRRKNTMGAKIDNGEAALDGGAAAGGCQSDGCSDE